MYRYLIVYRYIDTGNIETYLTGFKYRDLRQAKSMCDVTRTKATKVLYGFKIKEK